MRTVRRYFLGLTLVVYHVKDKSDGWLVTARRTATIQTVFNVSMCVKDWRPARIDKFPGESAWLKCVS